ncbi:MAG: hypothetical protein CL840_21550 [Crocinitomicaceae bacterium]|nr:hypothetical protein [Crocinitomicaceae bacterium]|tara:strand:- start:99 stop:2381 length:2283 start_codon:yes stop_codon:yes gene_type:complete
MKIPFSLFLLFLLFCYSGYSQQEKYSKIRIQLEEEATLEQLIHKGLLIDHFSKSEENSIDVELSATEISKLDQLQVSYEVIVRDIEANLIRSNQNFKEDSRAGGVCDLKNFTYGTMGHYHTLNEVMEQLDSMHTLFPNLISKRDSVGHSIEGRAIYAVKISDNPATDESSTEGVVYYDALHHSREPMSMEPLLYYMWWLLENYGTNAEATYLVNHRELHFIPVVNPDGYVYNQTIKPNGGGMWRKNRRDVGGGEYGVDLNRNYSSQFGNPIGASSDSSSSSYHGKSAFSEPETQAVRDYVNGIKPSIAFTSHSHGQKFLISPGCRLPNEDFESYAEFSTEFVTNAFDGFGTTYEMLNYTSCGTTRHFMHDEGIYSWTPEIGSSFWPAKEEFCSTVKNFQPALRYIAHMAGSSPRINDFEVLEGSSTQPGDTVSIAVRIKNRGLSFNSDSVTVELTPTTSNSTVVSSTAFHNSIGKRNFSTDTFKVALDANAKDFDLASVKITVKEGEYISDTVSKNINIGKFTTLFKDKADSGLSHWISPSWDTTFISMQSGTHSFVDSRYGNYKRRENSFMILDSTLDLTNSIKPILKYNAKWSFEDLDYVYLQISVNSGFWTTIKQYTQHEFWNQEQIDLSAYKGQKIKLRFNLVADAGVQSDGFYFDDFEVVDYTGFKEIDPASLAEHDLMNDVVIYPNPTDGIISVNMASFTHLDMKIFHCTGKQVLSTSLDQESFSVDISDLPAGLYFANFTYEGNSRTRSVILQ